jgi:hypothetical protein
MATMPKSAKLELKMRLRWLQFSLRAIRNKRVKGAFECTINWVSEFDDDEMDSKWKSRCLTLRS